MSRSSADDCKQQLPKHLEIPERPCKAPEIAPRGAGTYSKQVQKFRAQIWSIVEEIPAFAGRAPKGTEEHESKRPLPESSPRQANVKRPTLRAGKHQREMPFQIDQIENVFGKCLYRGCYRSWPTPGTLKRISGTPHLTSHPMPGTRAKCTDGMRDRSQLGRKRARPASWLAFNPSGPPYEINWLVIFANGNRFRQSLTRASLVVASLNPCSVSGCFAGLCSPASHENVPVRWACRLGNRNPMLVPGAPPNPL